MDLKTRIQNIMQVQGSGNSYSSQPANIPKSSKPNHEDEEDLMNKKKKQQLEPLMSGVNGSGESKNYKPMH